LNPSIDQKKSGPRLSAAREQLIGSVNANYRDPLFRQPAFDRNREWLAREGKNDGMDRRHDRRDSDRRRFVDQHDRNSVSDGIPKTALFAHQRRVLLTILECAPTLRADEDVKQLFGKRHESIPAM
jgi:hypothetical protein